MNAVAAQNVRVKDPVYHIVLSWPAGETPTDDQAFACGAHAMRAVGMEGHQYVFGMHKDTKNVHMHVAVNRVNPDTFKAIYPDRDFYKLDRAMRELELRFGWQHDKGPFAVFERNGEKVVDWSRAAPDTKGAMPTAAADMERHADRESFFGYVRGEPRADVMAALKDERLTWQQLHRLLAEHGLALREKGQGFAIFDTAGRAPTPIKASDMHEELSKARLIGRLGAFEPASEMPASDTRYDEFQVPLRVNQKRETRKQERADARRDLWTRYLHYKAEQVLPRFDANSAKARFLALRNEARRRRAEVRAMTDRAQRKANYSVIAFEMARERERLKLRIQSERLDLRKEVKAQRLSFREWVERQAANGDAAAISQLRGWAYAAKRKGQDLFGQDTDANAIKHASPVDPSAELNLVGSHYRVRRDGSVRYSFDQTGGGFVDHGSVIEVPGTSIDRMTLTAALIFARKKYGVAFEVSGSAQFKHDLSQLAATFPDEKSLAQAWHQSALEHRAKGDTLRLVKPRASPAPSL
jgi:hypothetical protein